MLQLTTSLLSRSIGSSRLNVFCWVRFASPNLQNYGTAEICGVDEAGDVPLAAAATNNNKTAMRQDRFITPFAEANNLFLMALRSPFL